MQIISSAPSQSLSQSLIRVYSTDGLMSLWRGVNSVIMGAGPAHAVYFGTYEIVKEATGGNRPGHQFASTGASGFIFPAPALLFDGWALTLELTCGCSDGRSSCDHHVGDAHEPLRR